jgi:hypothetical protein
VVGIVACNLGGAFVDVIAAVIVILVNVAAEDGDVERGVALAEGGLRAVEAAVDFHTVLQRKGGAAIAGRAWVMHTSLDPDLIAARGAGQGGLQGAGVCPTGTVAAARSRRRGVAGARRAGGPGGRQERRQRKEQNEQYENSFSFHGLFPPKGG